MLELLLVLKQQKKITEANFYFAQLIAHKQQRFHYAEDVQNMAILLALLCHYSHQQGHSCLYLDNSLWRNALFIENKILLQYVRQHITPPVNMWQSQLLEQKHIAFTAQPTKDAVPFVFQNNAVYLHRVWQDEKSVADYFLQAINSAPQIPANALIEKVISFIYTKRSNISTEIDWQKIAIAMAIKQPFTFISGGPGTGKTTTVTSLLIALQLLQIQQNLPPLRIQLVAPTGKAAARLGGSISELVNMFDLPMEIKNLIPRNAITIHLLLGIQYFSEKTRYDADNKVDIDVLVIDEISMIDLSLMARLLQSLKKETKLILLGDKDQLSSVEAGSIIAELSTFIITNEQRYSRDLVQYLAQTTGFQLPVRTEQTHFEDYFCHLTRSHRFSADSGIGKLARLIHLGEDSWSFLQNSNDENLNLFPYQLNDTESVGQTPLDMIKQQAATYYKSYFEKVGMTTEFNEETVQDIFREWQKVGFLTALRMGEYGVENLNQEIAEYLKKMGIINFAYAHDWYIGKPIIITENDQSKGIFNGDIGLFLGTSKTEGKVWFESGKKFSVTSIPHYEPAFAITVHKSQGSEFAQVVLVLPPKDSPVLSKELIYTAVTRAKAKFSLFSSAEVWQKAVKRATARQSGLAYWLKK